jgi:hypothetical protein
MEIILKLWQGVLKLKLTNSALLQFAVISFILFNDLEPNLKHQAIHLYTCQ